MNRKDNNETSADVRNKLRAGKLALEMLRDGRAVPKKMVELALKDLNKILEILDKE